ncbi:MAG: hypothetical protein M1165_01940 [Candidatus Pacearchaeota archaeon]|nr:hypothetical protein [Candidatus Pacearchaeota archaeon]
MKKSVAFIILSFILLGILINSYFLSADFIDSGDSLSPSHTSNTQNQLPAMNNSFFNQENIYVYSFLGMIGLFILVLIILLVILFIRKIKQKNL